MFCVVRGTVRALLVQEPGLDRVRGQDGVAGGGGLSETGAVVQAGDGDLRGRNPWV